MQIKDFLVKLLLRYTIFHFLNLFLFAICVIFSIIDISAHIRSYYRYPIIVNTKLLYQPDIYLPTVTICFPTIIDVNLLRSNYPNVYQEIVEFNRKKKEKWEDYAWRGILADHLTIGEIRMIQANFKHLFISCMFRTNQDKFVDCNRYVPIQHQFSLNHNCFILFEQDEREVNNRVDQFNFSPDVEFDYKQINRTDLPMNRHRKVHLLVDKNLYEENFRYKHRDIKNKDWIRIMINKTTLVNQWVDLGISYRGRFYEIYHGQPNFMCISTEVVNSVEFTFSQQNIYRLKEPYESNCFDYPSLGYKDRGHYVETCYANLTLEQIGRFPFFLETSDNKLANIDAQRFARHLQDDHSQYYFNCSDQQNRPNCNYTQYEIRLNQINFCDKDKSIDPSAHDYLLSNFTDALQAEIIERTQLLGHIAKDDKKNQILIQREKKLMESNSCQLKHFLMIIQFTDEYVTELVYEEMIQFSSLLGNIGQSISVYLGLCVFDLHMLFETFFDWLRLYREGDAYEERAAPLRQRKDRLSQVLGGGGARGANLGRKLSKQLVSRFGLAGEGVLGGSRMPAHSRPLVPYSRFNRTTLDDLNKLTSLSEKIKQFESIQGQFKELNRNHNLQTVNHALLSRYNPTGQLNGQLAPFNWTVTRLLNEDLMRNRNNLLTLNNRVGLLNGDLYNGDLYKDYPIQPENQSALLSIIENKRLNGDNNSKLIKRVQLTHPSLIYVDDYLYKVIDLHKKNNFLKPPEP